MATVPSESVGAARIPLALGLCMGISEILGGVISPIVAGVAADRYGLAAPLWLLLGLAALSTLVALGLRETAPAKRQSAVAGDGTGRSGPTTKIQEIAPTSATPPTK